jgi:hypothetical protein
MPSRIAFSTLAFPDATLAAAARAGRYGGFSGPEGFTLAARSLKLMLNELGIPWR